MSGPNPPGPESEELEPGVEPSEGDTEFKHGGSEFGEGAAGQADADGQTGRTDAYSRAYSAPESEHFSSGPYVPADPRLYDYDAYEESLDSDDGHAAPRWPWVVGIVAIFAAIALVVSVSLLVARTDTDKRANPGTTTTPPTPPMQDEITTTAPPPPPTTEIPTATETQTVTVTPSPPPPPPPPATPTAAPPPVTTTTVAAPPPTTTTTPTGPRQVTYSVTGTKAPGDIISVTYV